MKYAVVRWYNYRKELSAEFLKGFDDFEMAKKFAHECAKNDSEDWDNEDGVITLDDITDNNGPGKYGNPYYDKTIIGYGGRDSTGYSTDFYCVVEWFNGVENEWNDFADRQYWVEKYGTQWYPEY
jgi:hypothetical protein